MVFWGTWLSTSLLLPLELPAEFYRYVDQNGHTHFVDDKSKVPPEYIDNLIIYKEKYDHLPEDEKIEQRQKDAIEAEKIRQQQENLLQLELIKKRKQEEIEQEAYLKSLQTKVTINGNSVIVPVTLYYKGYTVEAPLLLDTGASVTTLHQKIADQLQINQAKDAKAKVISGKEVDFQITRVDYIKVGRIKLENPLVGIIKHQGPPVAHNGLLGMNFLRHFDYSIDFEKQVINWKP